MATSASRFATRVAKYYYCANSMGGQRASRLRGGVTVDVLGTGDAFASRGRFQAGYIIEAGGFKILMEAGPTVLAAMKRLGHDPADLDVVLISHLHGDHFAGLGFLILDYLWDTQLKRNLTVAGPRLLKERTWALYRTMFPGSDTRRVERRLKFVVLSPGSTTRLGAARVGAIRTPHTKPDISLALKVAVGGKTIVFSGDTGWTDELVPFAAGADLFLCECTYFDSTHLDFHLNYPLLERNRDRFEVGRMVLTHVGREVLERGAEVKFEIACDGMRIRV